MYKIELNGDIVYAEDGERLSEVLIRTGQSVEHLCGGLGTCRKCKVWVNGQSELSCQYVVHSDITVQTFDEEDIYSESGARETQMTTEHLCLALDIGTTTLALALVSLDNNQIVKVITRTNPQRAFGADVINRIKYCSEHGVAEVQAILLAEINDMIQELPRREDMKLYVSGNVTMLHLFLGVDPKSMGMAPYTPVFLEPRCQSGEVLDLQGVSEIATLPSIATFVGADVVAGLNLIERPKEGKYQFLVDLGTNAEVVLYSKEHALCTAAAAGPCFEGANISCGMSATNGAICAYAQGEAKTIGDAKAKGICGTGLVDIVAELLEDGTIDESGYMEEEAIEITDGVRFSRGDVRQYQLAKSAVCSAMMTLLREAHISFSDVEKVYISGGFSAKINIQNAAKTGLIPKELADKCVAVHNSSLLGTVKYSCEGNDLSQHIETATYVDLSANATFAELFITNMMFEEN